MCLKKGDANDRMHMLTGKSWMSFARMIRSGSSAQKEGVVGAGSGAFDAVSEWDDM